MKSVYMDHQAGTPIDPKVIEAMGPYLNQVYGNPSSTHSTGQLAKEAVEKSRETIARLIGAEKPEEIVFTSGGTESNNLALEGYAQRNRERGNHIIVSSIEHLSILNTCKHLAKIGFEITYLPVDKTGLISPELLRKELTDRTILVSIMTANGEVGTIEPIHEIGQITEERGVAFHTDVVAATGKIPINVKSGNIAMASLSSNDMYGPKGVGALYVRTGTRISPIILGGGQERGLRSGSENVASIVGMAKAAEIASSEMSSLSKQLIGLRDRMRDGILDTIPSSYLNGHPTLRLPDNLNVRFSYIEGESLVLSLDMEGISASSGSACTSKTLEPSHVLLALGLAHEEAHGSLLLSLGRGNTDQDVNHLLSVLPGIVQRLRKMSPLTPKNMVL
ncbi:MAG: cysteine desulfurase family protein [archaeon]